MLSPAHEQGEEPLPVSIINAGAAINKHDYR